MHGLFQVQLTQMDTQIVERRFGRGHYSLSNVAKYHGRTGPTFICPHAWGFTDLVDM